MATAESNNATGTPDNNPRKRKVMLVGLVLIVILGVVGVWGWYELYGRFNESTDDAYVNGNVVEITPLVTGTVVSIGADDGDLVHEGQVLINFDPNDAAVGLQSAQANLARTVRQVRGLYSNVDGMKAQVNAQKADVQTAQDNYNRRKTLAQGGAISQEELSHARDSLTAAKNALTNLEQQLKSSNALVDDTVISSHPDVQAAAAQLRQAYLANARSTLIAPRHRLCGQAHRATGSARAAGDGVDGGDPAEPAVDRRQLQGNPTAQYAYRPAGGHRSGHLRQRCEVQRHHRQPRRRHRQRVCLAACAERHRQLDQDRATGAGTHPRQCRRTGQTPPAGGLEHGGQRRPA
jgi:multidrug efflux pump subunit AcrA (membrane-fusion protein)